MTGAGAAAARERVGPATERGRSAARMAQPRRDPAGPAAEDARNPDAWGSVAWQLRGRPSGGSSAPRRPSGGCVLRHCSRASSPYPDVCPCPKVDNRLRGRQLAYAPGKWLFVGQAVQQCRHGGRVGRRSGTRSGRGHRSGSGSFSQLISSVEKADRVLLVREVPQPVEQPPAVRRFDVLPRTPPRCGSASPGRASRADAASAPAPGASSGG